MTFEEKPMKFDGLDIEGVAFAPSVAALGSAKPLVLGGAGDRGLEINGNYIKFTAIGIYIEDGIIPHLSSKLSGKTVLELCEKDLLFEEVIYAPFEKLVRVVFIAPLTGIQYSEKVLERISVQALYTDIKEEHKQQFLEIFKGESFPPQSSAILSFSKEGLKVAFSKGDDVPAKAVGTIENARFADAVLGTIIWRDGVSPAAKVSLAERVSKYLQLGPSDGLASVPQSK
uniref:Chalcone-flavonone isomerase family protein n=1 Tax=Lindsaea orbiculata TaxID=641184 RepID=A0A4Y6I0S2_9MONI|nr:chalcone isomerase [Lindsaea orbiculata]